ncbi:MAG: glycosyltransferase family 4 protein [Anaerolineae bacterium]|nr:glycosyltransferase family 4 protein [Anaerolineae bacterium]
MSLAVLSTHPIQYHAPVYRVLQAEFDIPVTVIYGSDFSVSGYHDREFGVEFAWDTDLVSGYDAIFLSQIAEGGARDSRRVSSNGAEQHLARINPKAVLLQGYSTPFHRRAFWTAWRTRAPLLLRAETTDHALQRGRAKRIVRDTLLRALYSQFSRLLYIGNNSKAHYLRLGCQESRLTFSPYCVDTAVFRLDAEERDRLRSDARAEVDVDSSAIVLLFSGKLSQRKGPQLILQAAKTLPDELRQRIVVLFMGDGDMRSALEQLALSAPTVDIRLLGFKNQSLLSRYYHAADLMILPSQTGETWGLVVNEALHHGLPCIVSDRVGCAPDLVKPGITGEVFAVDSVTELAAAIQRGIQLLQKPDTRQRCLELISHYTVRAAASGIAQAYREVTQQV